MRHRQGMLPLVPSQKSILKASRPQGRCVLCVHKSVQVCGGHRALPCHPRRSQPSQAQPPHPSGEAGFPCCSSRWVTRAWTLQRGQGPAVLPHTTPGWKQGRPPSCFKSCHPIALVPAPGVCSFKPRRQARLLRLCVHALGWSRTLELEQSPKTWCRARGWV